MRAAAISKIMRKIRIVNIINSMMIPDFCPDEPISDINKWLAIMFAVDRIAKVKGRTIRLIVSIITTNGIRINGGEMRTCH